MAQGLTNPRGVERADPKTIAKIVELHDRWGVEFIFIAERFGVTDELARAWYRQAKGTTRAAPVIRDAPNGRRAVRRGLDGMEGEWA